MAKEMVISTSRVNSYGSRVLTSGLDIGQYRRNPILLWMHRRYNKEDVPIGKVDNLRVDGDLIIGTPVFDTKDPFAQSIAHKWEQGILNMCSAGLTIIELSDAPEHVLPGQTRMTITRSRLNEVSIVDMGANDDAIKLYNDNGQEITLAMGAPSSELPLLKTTDNNDNNDNNHQKSEKMNEELRLALSLPEGSGEADVLSAIAKLKKEVDESRAAQQSLIESEVKEAIRLGKISAEQQEHFTQLGKTMGLMGLRVTLSAIPAPARPSTAIQPSSSPVDTGRYSKLSDIPPGELETFKRDNPTEYRTLYRDFFGQDPA